MLTQKRLDRGAPLCYSSRVMGRIPAVLYAVHKIRVIGACGFKSHRPYHLKKERK